MTEHSYACVENHRQRRADGCSCGLTLPPAPSAAVCPRVCPKITAAALNGSCPSAPDNFYRMKPA